jgi:hypothetical protein
VDVGARLEMAVHLSDQGVAVNQLVIPAELPSHFD